MAAVQVKKKGEEERVEGEKVAGEGRAMVVKPPEWNPVDGKRQRHKV